MSIFEQATLYSLPDRILLVPDEQTNSGGGCGILCIDRKDGNISLQPSLPSSEALKAAKKKTVYGIIGMAETRFLLVITRKISIGDLGGHTVFRAETVEIIDLSPLRPKQQEDEDESVLLRNLLVNVLTQPYFYFSYTTDLSHTQQRLAKLDRKSKVPSVGTGDTRFIWNGFLLSQFLNVAQKQPAVSRFLVPIIHGAIFISRCSINRKNFSWSIISRRSRCYVGARLFTRGCDDRGHAANFVETEQVVESEAGAVSSFVQTRGSMPLYWNQYPDLRYKPPPKLIERGDSLAVFLSHFKEQIAFYGKQVMVNLVDQKGAEGELALNLRNVVDEAKLSELQYIAFDFHKECAKMQYGRLQLLVDKLQDFIKDNGYYFRMKDDPASMVQSGIIRTNCIDSLDRTNVVQSLMATENLRVVLTRMGILDIADGGDPFRETKFRDIFRNTWADNADLLSVQYAGTGALKTDFTRTGQRSRWGLLQDGWNASIRYYLNNFMDGDRTDALKIFVGEFTPEQFIRMYYTSRQRGRGAIAYLPSVLLAFSLVLVLTLTFTKETSGQFFAIVILCLILIAIITRMILQNGKEFVNWPVTLKKI